jgi:antitoxin MazE
LKLQIQKSGNSLALRIPKAFAAEINVTPGSTVEMTLENGNIVVKSIREASYTLDELVEKITHENRHDEIHWSGPMNVRTW